MEDQRTLISPNDSLPMVYFDKWSKQIFSKHKQGA